MPSATPRYLRVAGLCSFSSTCDIAVRLSGEAPARVARARLLSRRIVTAVYTMPMYTANAVPRCAARRKWLTRGVQSGRGCAVAGSSSYGFLRPLATITQPSRPWKPIPAVIASSFQRTSGVVTPRRMQK